MKFLSFTSLTATALISGNLATHAEEVSSVAEMISNGDASLFMRYRLETVDQAGLAENATASTLLTKLSYKTATFNGFTGYLEMTHTTSVGSENYNSTINGNTQYPVIADPEITELNQAYLSFRNKSFGLKAGRQGINLDNQRFIGTVGFRQNDQTYDAVMLSTTPVEGLKASYTYVWNVNRIFGNSHPVGDFDSKSHFLNSSYAIKGAGKLTAYGYLLDFDNAAALSSKTFGARFAGKKPVSENVKVGYELEYASQSDYKDNPGDYSTDYYHLATNVTTKGFTFSAGYEALGSDNGISFKTPLATLHKFNGWADKFLGTPANGLKDLYLAAAYKAPGKTGLGGLLLKAVYHDFKSDTGDLDYGSELDLLVSQKLTKYLTASIKAAFYNADTHATDTDKVWLTLQAKF